MTREEFCDLPLKTALGIIFDLERQRLESVPKPDIPRSPKYDDRLPRKGGFVWMSEMLVADLIWWRAKKQESVESGGQYADKDAKTVSRLDKWIAWRALFPTETWSGTRGDNRATAAPPSKEPKLNPWGDTGRPNGGRNAPPPSAEDPDEIDF